MIAAHLPSLTQSQALLAFSIGFYQVWYRGIGCLYGGLVCTADSKSLLGSFCYKVYILFGRPYLCVVNWCLFV